MVYEEKTYLQGDLSCSYRITYYRNKDGRCPKECATEMIVHDYDHSGNLVACHYFSLPKKEAAKV